MFMFLFSVWLDASDAFKDVLTEYFGDGEGTDSDSDRNDTDVEMQDVEAPATVDVGAIEKRYKVAVDRPIFITSADDTGSLQTCDESEDQAVSEFLMKSCCHLKCTEKFSIDIVVKNRQSARELNYYSEKEHVNFFACHHARKSELLCWCRWSDKLCKEQEYATCKRSCTLSFPEQACV